MGNNLLLIIVILIILLMIVAYFIGKKEDFTMPLPPKEPLDFYLRGAAKDIEAPLHRPVETPGDQIEDGRLDLMEGQMDVIQSHQNWLKDNAPHVPRFSYIDQIYPANNRDRIGINMFMEGIPARTKNPTQITELGPEDIAQYSNMGAPGAQWAGGI